MQQVQVSCFSGILKTLSGHCHICIQIIGGDPDHAADKKAHIAWRDVECLAYSFKGISMIDNLNGLKLLTKLQLDNNNIAKIENISHLVRALLKMSMHMLRGVLIRAAKDSCAISYAIISEPC